MRFFKKIEISKPKKQEKTVSECLSDGSIRSLGVVEESKRKTSMVNQLSKEFKENENNKKQKSLKEENTETNEKGIINEGFSVEEKTVEEATPENKKENELEKPKSEIEAIQPEKLEIKSENLHKEKRHSSGRKFKKRLAKAVDRPSLIHWITLCFIAFALWSIIYSIAGSQFIPGSQLFSLLVLFVLAYIAGELITLIKLPALLGMLLMGLLLRNVGFIHLEGIFMEVTSTLREMALCIILIRAGLGLDPKALRSLKFVILRLASIPGIVEGTITTIVTHFLLGLPWLWGMLLGAILAAVSPAVVIPCLFSLQEQGYGTNKGIPTLVVAAASLDDILAITVFGVVLNVIYSSGSSLTMQIVQGPLGILIGIIFGVIWGFLAHFIPHRNDNQVVLLRVLMIVSGGLMAIVGSGTIGFQGAGPLGCIIAAFVACLGWKKQDYTEENNPVADVFRIIWLIFQPILFGLIGSEVDLSVLELSTITNGLLALFCSLLARTVVSIFIAYGTGFNWKEKTFVAWAWFPKATVQAALGPFVLDVARKKGSEEEIDYAKKILILAVLAILITAPIGSALITILGPKLLTKVKGPPETMEKELSETKSLSKIEGSE